MIDTIDIIELRRMFAAATDEIRREENLLSQLDCVGGDGDHGTTMVRAMEKLVESLNTPGEEAIQSRLQNAGLSLLNVDGGASSAILGTFISGMGDVDLGAHVDCLQWGAALGSGLRAVSRQSKAQPGDKTMVDALAPAVKTFQLAAAAGVDLPGAMLLAANASRDGAESTKSMVARFGRAKYCGEKSLGSPDAGATSIALLFRGFSAALTDKEEL